MKNKRNIIIGIIAVVLIIVLTVLFYHSKQGPAQWQKTLEAVSNSSPATSTTDVTQESTTTSITPPIDLNNPKILANTRSFIKDPSVIHIREIFNEYLKGNPVNDDVFDTGDSSIEADLGVFDKTLYRSRFTVIAHSDDAMGRNLYDFIFLDYPQHVYSVLIYVQGYGNDIKPRFMSFGINDSYATNYGEELLRLNPRIKTDTTLSI